MGLVPRSNDALFIRARARAVRERREIAEAEHILERVGLQGGRDTPAASLDFGTQKPRELARARQQAPPAAA